MEQKTKSSSNNEEVNKELEVVRNNTSKALAAANELAVTNDEELAKATELLTSINRAGDMMKKLKDGIIKPMNEALKSVRAMFNPPEDEYEKAVMIVKQKMLSYHNAVEAKRRQEEARIAARVDKGTMKVETAARKIENMPAIQTKIATGNGLGSAVFKEEKKVVIVDENLIPRQYLVPDMVLIRRAALAGVEIPGVKIDVVKNIANTRA